MKLKYIVFLIAILFIGLISVRSSSFAQETILKLDGARNSITNQGNVLPNVIRNAKGNDVRTLERIYELNTSALTTIEAYMKMLRMALSFDGEINSESLEILNKWLLFIGKQCDYDIEYLDYALTETSDENTKEQINVSKNNLNNLKSISKLAIKENIKIFGR
jgi:hypothetical protein